MRRLRYFTALIAAAGTAAAILTAPAAVAQTGDSSTLPSCTDVGGPTAMGAGTTECASPGNVQINASPPSDPTYLYPWDDEFYGPALIIGNDAGGGGHGGHGGR